MRKTLLLLFSMFHILAFAQSKAEYSVNGELKAKIGGQVVLTVDLKNTVELLSAQMIISLPEGLTFHLNEDEEVEATPTNRFVANSFSITQKDERTILM